METVELIFLILGYIAGIGFLVSGLDDLFFDAQFLVYLFRTRKQPHLTVSELTAGPEQWIALFVPAWQEGGIVNKMADYASRVLRYERYDIFIGVYPNDPETNRGVEELARQNPRIHKVQVPHPGPTSKADCLNWIYRAMRLNEVPGTREYQVIALHDAEDILHPLLLKVYNHFIPRVYDMGQVPVFALELPVLRYWTGNTYVDDFAELHTKDLFIRESIGGVVPSAGVGTAFSRRALDKLAAENNGDPFFLGNLTEDYEVGIRIKRCGLRAGMIQVPVDRIVRRKWPDGSLGPPKTVTEVVATREAFPSTFRTAVRQRSRWILGISFQTWEQTGWKGTLPMRYTLLRDRRAPLTHLINMVGYVVLFYLLLGWAFRHSPWAGQFYIRPLLAADSTLWTLAIVDSWLLAFRAAQKFISVQAVYNTRQAIFSIPRVVVGNFINFTATLRALRMYAANKISGRPIVWLKTAHVFPAESELAAYSKTIEDLLVEQGLITREQIMQALKLEKGSAPLCLLRMGLLQEKDFTGVWARHSRLPVRFINPFEIPEPLLRSLPESKAAALEAVPAGFHEAQAVVAFREPPRAGELASLDEAFGAHVQPVLATPSNIAFARAHGYPRLLLTPSRLSGALESFRQAAGMEPDSFWQALSERHHTGLSVPDVLVDMGRLNPGEARRLWAEVVGHPPLDVHDFPVHQELYFGIGPFFWWVHRMMPISAMSIACAHPSHPEMVRWLSAKMGQQPNLVAELPARLEVAARRRGVELDPDQALLDSLQAKGLVKPAEIAGIKSARQLISDPLPKWLLLQRLVTPEQLHPLFLEICSLPPAGPWELDRARRMLPLLPPELSRESGMYALDESAGAIRIGLAQAPSAGQLQVLYTRLAGHPVFFQALNFPEAEQLRRLASEND